MFERDDDFVNLSPADQSQIYAVFTNMIFDSFVDIVVRDHYEIRRPTHVTLMIDNQRSMLYVRQQESVAILKEDARLRYWAHEFILDNLLDLEPDQVDMIYLDGVVGAGNAYIHLAGDGILVTSGEPRKGRKYL
ncbi:MAG: hypothetical protein GYB68_09690 [Chloroflexi bacterium]|nr:hypothetical protein [Chloroflexota bacterium]